MTETVELPSVVNVPLALKIVITGGEGVGKSTTITHLSEKEPLRTLFGEGGDTVSVDCGKMRIGTDVLLYSFGVTAGPDLSTVIDDISSGALGGLVLVDPQRLQEARPAVEFFASQGLPFVVAVNYFDQDAPAMKAVGKDLTVAGGVPLVRMDPRNHAQVKAAVMVLLSVIMSHSGESADD